ncbi:MAG: AAA family ATPase [Protaetiibacter sp.]
MSARITAGEHDLIIRDTTTKTSSMDGSSLVVLHLESTTGGTVSRTLRLTETPKGWQNATPDGPLVRHLFAQVEDSRKLKNGAIDSDPDPFGSLDLLHHAMRGLTFRATVKPVGKLWDVEYVGPALSKPGASRVTLTPASKIRPRRAVWLKRGWIALGALTLLAGVEGKGKSTITYDMAARVTSGSLPGEFEGIPKSVLIAATEDDWEATIVPRLMAAGANLERVFRVETTEHDGLLFPRDNEELLAQAREVDAALLILDPLVSRFGDRDTHKDAEVRQGLEPLVAAAHAGRFSILGIIHLNKSEGTGRSLLNRVMGSKAFTAVARTVLVVMDDPDGDDPGVRLFGIAKSNLGKDDLPAERFKVVTREVTVFDPYTDEAVATEIGGIEYISGVPVTIDEAFAASSRRTKGQLTETGEEVENALYDLLTEPMAAQDVVRSLTASHGWDRKTIYAAAKRSALILSAPDPGDRRRTLWKRALLPGAA